MIDGSVTNKERQTTTAVIVPGVLFSPFSRPPTSLYFPVPPKRERLIACWFVHCRSISKIFVINIIRNIYIKQIFILVLILQRYENDTSPFLVERLAQKHFYTATHFHRSVCFCDCDVCYLFHRDNYASPYKCSNVEFMYSACVKKKLFVPVRKTHGWYRVI